MNLYELVLSNNFSIPNTELDFQMKQLTRLIAHVMYRYLPVTRVSKRHMRNSLQAVRIVNTESPSAGFVRSPVRLIKQALGEQWEVTVPHIYRQANACAD